MKMNYIGLLIGCYPDKSRSKIVWLPCIDSEAALDGLYVIRTSVEPEVLSPQETVKAYKSLSQVEQAFRSFKTVDLKV